MQNEIKVTIKKAKQIIHAVAHNSLSKNHIPQNVFMHGTMGVGKSQIIEQISKELPNLLHKECELIDLRLSGMEPADVLGIPYTSIVEGTNQKDMFFSTPSWWPTDSDKIYILFLDEFSNCSKSVQHAAYRLIQERSIQNGKTLGSNVMIVAAGNLKEDKTGAKPILPAAANRFGLHLYIDGESEEAVNAFLDWAVDNDKLNNDIVSYLSYDKTKMCTTPNGEAFARPRTWVDANEHYENDMFDDNLRHTVMAGSIGIGVATDFMGFLEYKRYLPDWDKVKSGEIDYELPSDIKIQFGVVSSFANVLVESYLKQDHDELNNLADVMEKLNNELIIVAIRIMKLNRNWDRVKAKLISDYSPRITNCIRPVLNRV